MRKAGIRGARRGRGFVRTTIADELSDRPSDLVKREFRASGPNRLWVADLTYVKTIPGWAYVAFITDVYSRMIVGWKVSASLKSEIATYALEMAIHARTPKRGELIHHSDYAEVYVKPRIRGFACVETAA